MGMLTLFNLGDCLTGDCSTFFFSADNIPLERKYAEIFPGVRWEEEDVVSTFRYRGDCRTGDRTGVFSEN